MSNLSVLSVKSMLMSSLLFFLKNVVLRVKVNTQRDTGQDPETKFLGASYARNTVSESVATGV